MSAIKDANQVAVVGSPSTNSQVVIDLLDKAAHEPLVGQMLFMAHPIEQNGKTLTEVGLGVVTEVTQHNQFHANPALRAVIKKHGTMNNLTGDAADARTASMSLQASYIEDGDGGWRQSGVGLSTAPPTGALLRQVSNDVLSELIAATTPDVHYLGYLHGSATRGGKVRAPFSIPDFNGPEGAFHLSVNGLSGSGKSAMATYLLASTLRFKDQGLILIDPQGQFASEAGLPFSLQGWAMELGRAVMVKRISEDLRLSKDAPLFTALLGKTKFLQELGRMAPENQLLLLDEVEKIVRDRDDWDSEDSESLLRHILSTVASETGAGENPFTHLGRVYADPKRCERLRDQIWEVLSSDKRMAEVLRYFGVIHNLFQPLNPAGGARENLREVVGKVINRSHDAPAPILILDMSTSDVSWLDTALADDAQAEILDALSILDQDNIKAAILRQVGTALKIISEAAFRRGSALNTIVMLDEAWRFVPPAGPDTEPEIKALSKDFAGYARDWRKFGLGLWFISQTTRSINPDIWDQLSVRFIGYGLGGSDLDRIADHLDSRNSLDLYKSFAPPKSTKPRIYPWLAMGPVSPLSFTKAPIAIAAYTNFDEFRSDNHVWIQRLRAEQGLSVLAGAPISPSNGQLQQAAAKLTKSSRQAASAAGLTKGSKAQLQQVRANRDTGGVDVSAFAGHSTDDSFGSLDLDLDDAKGPNGRPLDPATGEEFPF